MVAIPRALRAQAGLVGGGQWNFPVLERGAGQEVGKVLRSSRRSWKCGILGGISHLSNIGTNSDFLRAKANMPVSQNQLAGT